MKYIVFLGDGMADYPVEALDGKTPLMVAKKEHIDSLAPKSEIGLAKTVPDGMKPGSDTANLSVMGYDPRSCYSGRSPLEALSMGLTLTDTDIAVRCNLVTLSSEEKHYADKRMIDYSAGEISTDESHELITYLQEHLGNEKVSFHAGISYRHCLIVHDAKTGSDLTPPHDITGKIIKRHLPSGKLGDLFLDLQKRSYDLLKEHPINLKRIEEGKNPANSIWFWGEGTKPNIPDFREKNGITGAVISAVDLLKGIGKGANLKVIDVPGATGNIHTDFAAKGKAAIDALSEVDYVYIHVEAPDESGHQGSLEDKIKSIERIDADIVGPVLEHLRAGEEPFHILVCPDHPTPLSVRTHTSDPIPYLLYRSDAEEDSGVTSYDEESAKSTGIFQEEGFHLIDRLLTSEPSKKAEVISPDIVTLSDGSEAISLTAESTSEEKAEGETADATDATENTDQKEGDASAKTDDISAEGKEGEKPAKEKKPSKFGAFFKRHLVAFIIVIAALLVAGGLTAGHFIMTYHISFIRSEEGLNKALSKDHITTLVFKKDVTVSSDLAFPRTVNLDLNEYTLTINGDLFLPIEDDLSIGYKTKGKYTKGGKIIAKKVTLTGTKNLVLYADLETVENNITCSKADIEGDFAGANTTTAFNAAEINYRGKAAGIFTLSSTSVLTMNGDVKEIQGGKSISYRSGKASVVSDAAELYLYEEASVEKIVNVTDFYRVTKLAVPDDIIVLEEGGDFVLYVSEVIGATEIRYTLNGEEKEAVEMTPYVTKILLSSDDLIPGEQKIKIRVAAKDNPCYLESDEKECTFEFSAKLATPTATISEEGESVHLIISEVKHADSYTYVIDGTEHTTKDLNVDISEDTAEGGVHIIKVTAKSDNRYYEESNAVMTSYIRYIRLAPPTLHIGFAGEKIVISWDPVENATEYLLRYGEDTEIYTTLTSVELPYDETATLTICTKGSNFRTDSVEIVMTAAEIQAILFPPVVEG